MRIAFVGFGEVARAFAPSLAARGAELSAYDELLAGSHGLEQLRARAGTAPVAFGTLAEALVGARLVLSTVTTTAARQAALQCAPYVGNGQIYVDLNATDAAVKQEIGGIVERAGAAFVEGALLGAVGVSGVRTEILLGGPHAHRAASELTALGLNARFYSEQIGKASTFKLLRSVFSKGMEALLIEFLVAGERAGMREDLWREVKELFATQPFDQVAANWVRTHAAAHERRYHEVKQVTDVLRALGVEPVVTAATEAFFERSRRFRLAPAADMDEVVRVMSERLGR